MGVDVMLGYVQKCSLERKYNYSICMKIGGYEKYT